MICYKTFSTETREEVTTKDLEIACLPHTEVESEEIEMTCTRNGRTAGKYCSVCYIVLEGLEVVPATGHKEVIDKAVAATCTENGKTAGKHCSVCDAVFVAQEEISATGHTEVPIAQAIAVTCTENGMTAGKRCSVCNTVLEEQQEIPATGHNLQNDECTECDFVWYLDYTYIASTESYAVTGIGTAYGDVEIPSEHNGRPVTQIGDRAFSDCNVLTSITIPESVTSIKFGAFLDCVNLVDITIPDGVTLI